MAEAVDSKDKNNDDHTFSNCGPQLRSPEPDVPRVRTRKFTTLALMASKCSLSRFPGIILLFC
jgi:hypothetical protein